MYLKKEFIGSEPRLSIKYLGIGDLVILLHGIGGNKDNWDKNIVEVSKYFKVVSCDIRGYGESEDFDGPMNFNDVADDIVKIINHFEVDDAHIVGLSMGAQISTIFFQKYPNKVKSLTLCDAPEGFDTFSEAERMQFIRLRRKPIEEGVPLHKMARAIADTLIGNKANYWAYAQLINSMKKIHRKTYLKAIEAFIHTDYSYIFPSINIPTLIIVGELDKLTTVKSAKNISNSISGSHLKVVPGAGHLSNIENFIYFNRVLIAFLRSIESCKS